LNLIILFKIEGETLSTTLLLKSPHSSQLKANLYEFNQRSTSVAKKIVSNDFFVHWKTTDLVCSIGSSKDLRREVALSEPSPLFYFFLDSFKERGGERRCTSFSFGR